MKKYSVPELMCLKSYATDIITTSTTMYNDENPVGNGKYIPWK